MRRDKPNVVRCAIYERKSSDENLDSDFNSLDAQRESCEAYARSQVSEGWQVQPQRYSDGGYSGGTMDRPALKQLMADINGGQIDVVLIYKIDRLSRSLADFAQMAKTFDEHNVSFVSVTQRLDTSTSAGRLMLNVLLSFAQFEREIVSERTRDKIALSRRKGKWAGGRPPLGYDIDRDTKRLVINAEEAEQVREIFRFYTEHQRLLAVVRELARRGWRNKQWVNSKGRVMGGRAFDKASLRMLLINPIYAGLVRHKAATYPGQHQAIVDEAMFGRVQDLLQRNGRNGGADVRNKHGALLRGLLVCACCNRGMRYSYSSKPGGKRYAYYLCASACTRGWDACPAPSVPAGGIEAVVVERIREIARDPALITETVRQARGEAMRMIKALEAERKELQRTRDGADRLHEIDHQLRSLRSTAVSQQEVVDAFARFDRLWASLEPCEQIEVVRLLVQRVEWDGRISNLKIVFHPTGLSGLVEHAHELQKVVAA